MWLYQAKLRRYHKMATRIQCAWRIYAAKATLMVMVMVVVVVVSVMMAVVVVAVMSVMMVAVMSVVMVAVMSVVMVAVMMVVILALITCILRWGDSIGVCVCHWWRGGVLMMWCEGECWWYSVRVSIGGRVLVCVLVVMVSC